jgi:hypothetical protein
MLFFEAYFVCLPKKEPESVNESGKPKDLYHNRMTQNYAIMIAVIAENDSESDFF